MNKHHNYLLKMVELKQFVNWQKKNASCHCDIGVFVIPHQSLYQKL